MTDLTHHEGNQERLGAQPAAAIGSRLTELRWGRADVLLLAALILLTATFGKSFSTVGIGGSPIYISEILLGLAALAAAARIGLGPSITAIRRLPLIPLVIFWIAGVIATARGLVGESLTNTLEDIGLFEYSLLLPLIAMAATSLARVELIRAALVWGAVAGTFVYLFSDLSIRIFDTTDTLFDVEEITFGLYMAMLVAHVANEFAHDREPPRVIVVTAAIALVLVFLTNARMVWVGLLAAIVVVVLLAPREKLAFAGRTAAVMAAGLVLAVGIQQAAGASQIALEISGAVRGVTNDPPESVTQPALAPPGSPGSPGSPGAPGAPGSPRTLGATTSTAESDNAAWRIAFWGEAVDRTVGQPLFGAGFGEPFRFVWEDRKYDFRDGDPGSGIDVAGTHNSFVYVLYRMGLPALLALIALIAIAAMRMRSALQDPSIGIEARSQLIGLAAMGAAAAGVAAFSDAFKGPFLALFFWVPLALILVACEFERRLGPGDGV